MIPHHVSQVIEARNVGQSDLLLSGRWNYLVQVTTSSFPEFEELVESLKQCLRILIQSLLFSMKLFRILR
jgi:hypothetical protein